jgi:hypothetical protein
MMQSILEDYHIELSLERKVTQMMVGEQHMQMSAPCLVPCSFHFSPTYVVSHAEFHADILRDLTNHRIVARARVQDR